MQAEQLLCWSGMTETEHATSGSNAEDHTICYILGYYEIGRIPRGARNIHVIEEECCTHSYIAVKSATPPFK